MSIAMAHSSVQAYPYYKEIGERVLEVIAPPDSTETPLNISCRPESIGMYVETVVQGKLVPYVAAIGVSDLMAQVEEGPEDNKILVDVGERKLREVIQHYMPTFELHRTNRTAMAHLTAAINSEGLWPKVAEVIESASEAKAYFEIAQRDRLDVEIEERRSMWEEITAAMLEKAASEPKPSPYDGASISELETAISWLEASAFPIVERGDGIPQHMDGSGVYSIINPRLKELAGVKMRSEKLDMFHEIAVEVKSAWQRAHQAIVEDVPAAPTS